MVDIIEIQWTSGSIDEARKISRYLVQERYVACAQITPWIESIYQWNNQIETAQESKVSMKTTLANLGEVKEIILQNSKYQVPEITYHPIEVANEEYLSWLQKSTEKSQV